MSRGVVPAGANVPADRGLVPYLLMTAWVAVGVVILLPAMQPHVAGYSDWVTLYLTRHWAHHPVPYLHQPIEYPVLLGWGVWLLTWVPGGETGFVLANGVLMWGAAVGVYRGLHHLAPRAALYWAATPLLMVYATQNWCLWGLLPLVAAWVQYERGRWGWSGAWLAVGTAVKLFPVVAWPFMAYGLWRQRNRRAVAVLTGVAGATWLAVNLPTLLAAPAGWLWFWCFNASRPVGGDLWTTLHLGPLLTTSQWNAVTLGLVLAGAVVALAGMARGLSPRAATALVLTGLLALNKVWSPQYILWVFASACAADWPGWTLAVLSGTGLVDYANGYLQLVSRLLHETGHPQLAFWPRFAPWGVAVRYAGLASAGIGGGRRALTDDRALGEPGDGITAARVPGPPGTA